MNKDDVKVYDACISSLAERVRKLEDIMIGESRLDKINANFSDLNNRTQKLANAVDFITDGIRQTCLNRTECMDESGKCPFFGYIDDECIFADLGAFPCEWDKHHFKHLYEDDNERE